MIRHNLEFDMIIRGIVATRGEDGATITEMREDYFEIVCRKWPLQYAHHRVIKGYLMEIDGLVMVREPNGPWIWYVDDLGNISERINQQQYDANNNEIITIGDVSTIESVIEISSNNNSSYVLPNAPRVQSELSSLNGLRLPSKRHISFDRINLIEENLQTHNLRVGSNGIYEKTTSTEVECSASLHHESNDSRFPNGYLSNDANSVYSLDRECKCKCHMYNSGRTTENNSNNSNNSSNSNNSNNSAKSASISHWEVCVMGDDLMRLLISYQLFHKDLSHHSNPRYSFCLRGQTIHNAYNIIFDQQNAFKSHFKYILLNLGAIDILLGRDIIDIQTDFARLIRAINLIGLIPIITTLPPIRLEGNHPNFKEIYQTLLLFNNFLLTMFGSNHLVVNLCDIFIKANHEDPDKYYHNVPHSINVQGKLFKIYPWNHCGREKILETIDETINFEIPKDAALPIVRR